MAGDEVAPTGFPTCKVCPLLRSGSPGRCYGCVMVASTQVDGPPSSCPICSQLLTAGTACRNSLCQSPNRQVDRIHAMAYKVGDLEQKILAFKYKGKAGWALVFGRLIVGWLQTHVTPDAYDLIIPNPTHASRSTRHTELMIERAAAEDDLDQWSFDWAPWAVTKSAETPKSAGGSLAEKRAAAVQHREALSIDFPDQIDGARILVVDDVTTTGHQLDEVARLLKENGATGVEGLVVLRQTWGS